ncbi:cadherin repeat domain-containing protein [Fulvivirga sediminis]|uniref:Cadherin repeat domain-containing protein n=1 Tax=Fulvivirga sediminis TaxID=2803949 RepID=A0A937F733_9BACT|nr:cadherin repeat domain-containing protein [Fulvivirga sediminis]MBL3655188.1 cadherin repeat domain-containing protein [Fulvivirga sediminis]
MKKSLKFGVLLVIYIALFSCKDDDEVVTTITASDYTTSIDENSDTGTSIGTVPASTNTGEIIFSIDSQTPAGAMQINAVTGELTIAEASIFNYELNQDIKAIVRISVGEIFELSNVTINLNDKDDILHILSTSIDSYNKASAGDWIEVTKEEYDALESQMYKVSTAGLNDTTFISDTNLLNSGAKDFTLCTRSNEDDLNESIDIKSNEYIFAFKYVSMTEVERNSDEVKISKDGDPLVLTSIGLLPTHSGIGVHYFVLKGASIANSMPGYLAFYSSNSTGHSEIKDYYLMATSGNVNKFSNYVENIIYQYQGLKTSVKQW